VTWCALVLALGVGVGCGGAVEHNDADGSSGTHQNGGSKSNGGSSPIGRAGTAGGGSGGTAGIATSGGTGITDPNPVETGCKPEDLPPPDVECDAFTLGSCGAGLGCYPFVDHPEGSGCDQQRYGTVCAPAGVGRQGDLCGEDVGDFCAEGFACVVGQRAGKRCAALCDPQAPNPCAGGLICGDLDVAGFGVCG
jgi:hypothetical protein